MKRYVTTIMSLVFVMMACNKTDQVIKQERTTSPASDQAQGSIQANEEDLQTNIAVEENADVTDKLSLTATPNQVLGWIDGTTVVSGNTVIYGWACVVGYSKSISVQAFVNGPNEQGGIKIGSIVATWASAASINNLCKTSGVNHRFIITLRNDILTSYPGRSVFVHGINPINNNNMLLDNSGKVKIPAPNGTSDVPAKTIAFFNLTACPAGWSEFTQARGRYILALQAGGGLGGVQGTALTNLENRAVGQHSHAVNDPGHQHAVDYKLEYSMYASDYYIEPGESIHVDNQEYVFDVHSSTEKTNISIADAGTVPGTNAPYIQFLVCQKN